MCPCGHPCSCWPVVGRRRADNYSAICIDRSRMAAFARCEPLVAPPGAAWAHRRAVHGSHASREPGPGINIASSARKTSFHPAKAQPAAAPEGVRAADMPQIRQPLGMALEAYPSLAGQNILITGVDNNMADSSGLRALDGDTSAGCDCS